MSMRISRRVTGEDVALLVPAAAGTAAFAYIGGTFPLFTTAAGGGVLLILLPWLPLFVLLVALSAMQSHYLPFNLGGLTVAGLSFRWADAVIVPLAVRAFLRTNPLVKNRWKAPELMLVAYLFLNLVTSKLNAPHFRTSLIGVANIGFGVLAYLVVYTSVCTRSRLIQAAKAFVWIMIANALYGMLGEIGNVTIHTSFGITPHSAYGTGAIGFFVEHDVFSSACAATAIVCYCLWRERNPILSSRTAAWGFWISAIGMFFGLSRAAWLAFGLTFMAILLAPKRGIRRPRRIERVGLTLIVLATVGMVGSYVVTTAQSQGAGASATLHGGSTNTIAGILAKFQQLGNTQSGTGKARISELKTALDDLKQSPIIGLGTSTYDQRHPLSSTGSRAANNKSNYIGNLWLRVTYDSGLLGILLFFGAVALVLFPGRHLLSSRGELASIARALTFGWVVLGIAYAGTDDTLFMWPWVFLGLVRAARVLADREFHAMRRAPSSPVPALAGGGGNGRAPGLGRSDGPGPAIGTLPR